MDSIKVPNKPRQRAKIWIQFGNYQLKTLSRIVTRMVCELTSAPMGPIGLPEQKAATTKAHPPKFSTLPKKPMVQRYESKTNSG